MLGIGAEDKSHIIPRSRRDVSPRSQRLGHALVLKDQRDRNWPVAHLDFANAPEVTAQLI
jgi:hypothetical protein